MHMRLFSTLSLVCIPISSTPMQTVLPLVQNTPPPHLASILIAYMSRDPVVLFPFYPFLIRGTPFLLLRGKERIGIRTTGSQGHICYQDGGQRVSVTRAAVCMGVEEMGMQTRDRVLKRRNNAYRVQVVSNFAQVECATEDYMMASIKGCSSYSRSEAT